MTLTELNKYFVAYRTILNATAYLREQNFAQHGDGFKLWSAWFESNGEAIEILQFAELKTRAELAAKVWRIETK